MRTPKSAYPMNVAIVAILMIIISPAVIAQSSEGDKQAILDSLRGVWLNESEADSNRINAYQLYIWDGFLFSQTDSALSLTRELDEFVERTNNDPGRSHVLNLYGCYHFIRGEYPEALSFFEQKLVVDERIGDEVGQARTLENIGLVYQYTGDFPGAMRNFSRSYEVKKRFNDLVGMANSASNIGVIYLDQGMVSKAISYLEEARRLEEQLGEQRGLAGTYINIGNAHLKIDNTDLAFDYYSKALALCEEIDEVSFKANALSGLGSIASDRGALEEALDYYERSLDAHRQLGDRSGEAATLVMIGRTFQNMGKNAEALARHDESLRIRTEIGSRRGIAAAHLYRGNFYRHNGELYKALTDCDKSERLAEEIKAYSLRKDGCHCLYRVYKELGNNEKALYYFELKRQLEDSVDVSATARKLQEMEFRQEILTDSLQQEEEKLRIQMAYDQDVNRKTRSRNIAFGSGFVLLLMTGGLFSRNRYINRSKRIIEKEKNRSEELLLNILPYEIAEELKEKGEAGARDYETAAILFTDFQDFTETSSKMNASGLVAEVNTCFRAFDRIVENYSIEKIKTIGDAYMAAGGLPAPSEDAVARTVMAALDMQKFIIHRKNELGSEGKLGFAMRVGIHSGPVVAGIVGVKKFQYDVWGDTVNTASRMESNGVAGKVNISHSTYECIKDDSRFAFEFRGNVDVKGKGTIRMYFVTYA